MKIKKRILSGKDLLVCICCTTLLMSACEKANEESPSVNPDETNFVPKALSGFVAYYEPDHPLHSKCAFSGSNCWYPPIDIVPNDVIFFESYINLGATGVGQFFSEEQMWMPLFPMLSETSYQSHLAKLASGTYTMERKASEGEVVRYIATGGQPEEIFVFQVQVR